MNPQYDRQLEQEIDRELKELPELIAPATLSLRVLEAIHRRAACPWYRQPWQYWPVPLRFSALALLLALFGALSVATWQLTKAAGVSTALQEIAGLFSWMGTLWNVIAVLVNTVLLVAKHLGTVFMITCVAIMALGYAICLTLGSAWFRLASARR